MKATLSYLISFSYMFIFEAEVIPPTFIYLFIYFSDVLLFCKTV